MSKTPAAGNAGANPGFKWEDGAKSSGGKFKFIHLIVVSILFLLLGAYLAKIPVSEIDASTKTEE